MDRSCAPVYYGVCAVTTPEREMNQRSAIVGNQRTQREELAAVIKPSANFSAFDVAVQYCSSNPDLDMQVCSHQITANCTRLLELPCSPPQLGQGC